MSSQTLLQEAKQVKMVKSGEEQPITKRKQQRGSSRKGCMRGKGGPENASCPYKGVRQRSWGKWVAEIRVPNGGPRVWLGTFETSLEAAAAYDTAARKFLGDDAVPNIPDLRRNGRPANSIVVPLSPRVKRDGPSGEVSFGGGSASGGGLFFGGDSVSGRAMSLGSGSRGEKSYGSGSGGQVSYGGGTGSGYQMSFGSGSGGEVSFGGGSGGEKYSFGSGSGTGCQVSFGGCSSREMSFGSGSGGDVSFGGGSSGEKSFGSGSFYGGQVSFGGGCGGEMSNGGGCGGVMSFGSASGFCGEMSVGGGFSGVGSSSLSYSPLSALTNEGLIVKYDDPASTGMNFQSESEIPNMENFWLNPNPNLLDIVDESLTWTQVKSAPPDYDLVYRWVMKEFPSLFSYSE